MKNRFLFSIAIAAIFCSCDSTKLLESKNYQFNIFQFVDESYKELIITDGCQNYEDGSYVKIINGIFNYPKRYRGEPYYGIRERASANPEKYTFDICNVNPFELPVLGEYHTIYSDIRSFEIGSLEKITGKNRKEMTIDDIEQAVNKVIDEGTLGKYSKKVTYIASSKE